MKKFKNIAWTFYFADEINLKKDKVGKWMYFFDNKKFVALICEKAVREGVVKEAKHSNAQSGVSCFYLNSDDIQGHKKVITYFIENNLIRKTKNGRYHNISFKLDKQTRAGEYGGGFKSEITLDRFINLYTGEWII